MLHTSLEHILSKSDFQKVIEGNESVMICCGRMGPMCIPVYEAMTKLKEKYKNVTFADMEFDIPDAKVIRNAPEAKNFMGLPFTFFYKKGETVHATSSILSQTQIEDILDKYL